MPVIFAQCPGVAAAVVGNGLLPIRVTLENFGDYLTFKAVMTGFAINQQGNFQFMHTLRDFIYVYSFGERIGELVINGIAFAGICTPGNENCAAGVNSSTGFDNVFSYYDRNRLSMIGRPLKINFGQFTVLYGFLTNFNFQMQDPQMGLGQFSLRFMYVPRRSNQIPTFTPPVMGRIAGGVGDGSDVDDFVIDVPQETPEPDPGGPLVAPDQDGNQVAFGQIPE